ncbi:CDP-diacylglycerol--serine O-phosphatidyltransferase [Planococcaceae bacterium Storch 2/2-2]|nr:CDP-diacylglycerol--serine O-phosphatidyltransferase [Planococcaceae bacterium Storch 2/2-2]
MFLLKRREEEEHRWWQAQLANLLTLCNLSSSVLALIAIMNEWFHIAIVLLVVAALFDRFDGIAARKYDAASDFGKELDSLSDLVSFGVAPALLLYQAVLVDVPMLGITATVLFVVAGAIRLARYNVTEFDGAFVGLPITAAGVIAVLSYFIIPYISAAGLAIWLLVLAYFMVSHFKIAKV